MKMKDNLAPLTDLLVTLASTARLEILLVLGAGEACVCYLEFRLGYRQAYISQHLMALRQSGLIEFRREGRYIFYHLARPELIDLIQKAAALTGVNLTVTAAISPQQQCSLSSENIEPIIDIYQEQAS